MNLLHELGRRLGLGGDVPQIIDTQHPLTREIRFNKPLQPVQGLRELEVGLELKTKSGGGPDWVDAVQMWSLWWGKNAYSIDSDGKVERILTSTMTTILGAERSPFGYIRIFTPLSMAELQEELNHRLPEKMESWFNPRETFIREFQLTPLLPHKA